MTKTQWLIIGISAFTDSVISGASALTAAMVAGDMVQMPNRAVVVIALLGGLVAFARTIQQALRSTLDSLETRSSTRHIEFRGKEVAGVTESEELQKKKISETASLADGQAADAEKESPKGKLK